MTITEQQTLEARAAELRAVLDAPSEKESAAAELAEIERQIAEQKDAAGRTEAAKRMVGIARAYGSLAAQVDDDERRVRDALATAAARIEELNARFAKLAHLRAEAAALVDRFGVEGPTLPPVIVPVRRGMDLALPRLAEFAHVRASVEKDETGLRTRRDYSEIADSPGYALIHQVGLKPWPPLTKQQQAILAERTREVRKVAGFADAAAEIAALPSSVPAAGAGVHRG